MVHRDHSWCRCLASRVRSWLDAWPLCGGGWVEIFGGMDGCLAVRAVGLRFSAEPLDEILYYVVLALARGRPLAGH